jgi:ABC-type glycerol-3-phosphate transport system substrate-binding protein
MKTVSKLLTLLIAATLLVSIVGCTAAQPTATLTPEPTAVPATAIPPTDTPEPQPVTIRYAAHNLGTEEENNAERQLIAAYMALHPNVTIEIVDMSAEGGWEANLTAYAAKGEFPDVFSAFDLPLYIKNDWLADVGPVASADPDWQKIPQALRDSVAFNGVSYGVPSGQFIVGYVVNKDLYEAANLDAPEYGFSLEDYEAAMMGLNNPADGVLGLDEVWNIPGWLPNSIDPKLKWFSFDGANMNYNSAAFKEAIAKMAQYGPYAWDGLSDEQKTNFKSAGPWELFLNQEVGMRFSYGWELPGLIQNATFNWDFVGTPGGNQALVFDFIGIGKTTQNLQEAYNFAKWMAFSPDGYAKRVEIAKTMNSVPNMPVAVDDATLALYTSFYPNQPGLAAAMKNLDNSLIESVQKAVPGFVNARWEGKTGIVIDGAEVERIDFFWSYGNFSKFKFEDYSAQLEEFANKILAEARAGITK